MTITGTVTSKKASATSTLGDTTTLTFTSLTWQLGQCYPSGGTLQFKKGLLNETITFDSNSASTGKVTVTIGKKTAPAQLPGYGRCPM